MVVVLSLLLAVVVAGNNLLSAAASRRLAVVWVFAITSVAGFVVVAIACAVLRPGAPSAAALPGLAAGVVGGTGVLLIYAALARGAVGAVVPATVAASTALLVGVGGLQDGYRITSVAAGALAVVAVLVISRSSSGPQGREALPVVLAVLAGACFAGFSLIIDVLPDDEALTGLLLARTAVLALSIIAAAAMLRRQRPARSAVRAAWPSALSAGVLDGSANLLLLAALSFGNIVTVGVISACSPVLSALGARLALRERLDRPAIAGLLISGAGVLVATLGSS